jgi:hypothetical protein
MCEMDLIGVGGGQVGEGVEVAVEGIDLLLDVGEVNRNGDVDVRHLCSDSANGVKDNGVVMVGEGGGQSLDRWMDKKAGEDEAGKNGRSEEKMGSDHLNPSVRIYLF